MDIGEYLGVACNSTPSIRKTEDQGQGDAFSRSSLSGPLNEGSSMDVSNGGALDHSKILQQCVNLLPFPQLFQLHSYCSLHDVQSPNYELAVGTTGRAD